jgi:uncharacterized metal-binding protein
MIKAQRAEKIVVIDGCPLNCARHTLLNACITNFQHIAVQTLGQRTGNCPVTPDRVEIVTAMAVNAIRTKPTPAKRLRIERRSSLCGLNKFCISYHKRCEASLRA